MERKDVELVFLYTHESRLKLGIDELSDPVKGEVYKAFKVDGTYIIDTNDNMPMNDALQIDTLISPDFNFQELDINALEDVDLDYKNLDKISTWYLKSDEVVDDFLGRPKQDAGEKKNKEKIQISDKQLMGTLEPEIQRALEIFVADLVTSSINFKEVEMFASLANAAKSMSQDPEIGKGGNIIAIQRSLMGYLSQDNPQHLKHLIYHALNELNRVTTDNG